MKGTKRLDPGFAQAPSSWRLSVSSLWAASSSPLFHGSDNPNLGLIGQRVNAAHIQRQSSVYRRNETPAPFDTNGSRCAALIDIGNLSAIGTVCSIDFRRLQHLSLAT
jgi:hypothetical protein